MLLLSLAHCLKDALGPWANMSTLRAGCLRGQSCGRRPHRLCMVGSASCVSYSRVALSLALGRNCMGP